MRPEMLSLSQPFELLTLPLIDTPQFRSRLLYQLYGRDKHKCDICQFRCADYAKFHDHLDVHFQVNLMKKNCENDKNFSKKRNVTKDEFISKEYSTLGTCCLLISAKL